MTRKPATLLHARGRANRSKCQRPLPPFLLWGFNFYKYNVLFIYLNWIRIFSCFATVFKSRVVVSSRPSCPSFFFHHPIATAAALRSL